MLCEFKETSGVGANQAGAEKQTVSTYLTFEVSDQQTVKNLACFIAMPDVLESLGGILASDI